MNYVHSIKCENQLADIKQELLKGGTRNYLLFSLGINSGLRISDLLPLKAKDVRGRTHLEVVAKKTGKRHFISLANLQDEIKAYCRNLLDDEYLFKSREKVKLQDDGKYYRWKYIRKTVNGKTKIVDKKYVPYYIQPDITGYMPIGKNQAEKIISDAAKKVGIKYAIGTHTMRKTFAYHFYTQTKDIATLQIILGHDNPKQTLDYIGVTQDNIDFALSNFKI